MKKLDLHKTNYEEAKRKTIRFIEENWNSGETVQIVTGHSLKMKEIVGVVLDEYELEWQVGDDFGWNWGFIKVALP